MLNELHQVADALERQGLVLQVRHAALDPMPKNAPTLLVRLDGNAKPVRVEVVGGDIAGKWLRVKHGSPGSAFPGFNTPAPLCLLSGRAELLRLFALCPLDKANKQVSLHRVYTVQQVVQAARAWEKGASNCPPVPLPL